VASAPTRVASDSDTSQAGCRRLDQGGPRFTRRKARKSLRYAKERLTSRLGASRGRGLFREAPIRDLSALLPPARRQANNRRARRPAEHRAPSASPSDGARAHVATIVAGPKLSPAGAADRRQRAIDRPNHFREADGAGGGGRADIRRDDLVGSPAGRCREAPRGWPRGTCGEICSRSAISEIGIGAGSAACSARTSSARSAYFAFCDSIFDYRSLDPWPAPPRPITVAPKWTVGPPSSNPIDLIGYVVNDSPPATDRRGLR